MFNSFCCHTCFNYIDIYVGLTDKEETNLKNCRNCGEFLPDDANFCSKCGTSTAIPENKKCQNCGSKNEGDSIFCSNCGHKLNPEPVYYDDTNQHNRDNSLQITWKKEFKNSVPFLVSVNGKLEGTIKRGQSLNYHFSGNTVNLVFIPQCPKWYGWKTLTIEAEIINPQEVCELFLGILYPNDVAIVPNLNGQLHTNTSNNFIIKSEIQTK